MRTVTRTISVSVSVAVATFVAGYATARPIHGVVTAIPIGPVLANITQPLGNLTQAGYGKVRLSSAKLGLMVSSGTGGIVSWAVTPHAGATNTSDLTCSTTCATAEGTAAILPVPTTIGQGSGNCLHGGASPACDTAQTYRYDVTATDSVGNVSNTAVVTIQSVPHAASLGNEDLNGGGNYGFTTATTVGTDKLTTILLAPGADRGAGAQAAGFATTSSTNVYSAQFKGSVAPDPGGTGSILTTALGNGTTLAIPAYLPQLEVGQTISGAGLASATIDRIVARADQYNDTDYPGQYHLAGSPQTVAPETLTNTTATPTSTGDCTHAAPLICHTTFSGHNNAPIGNLGVSGTCAISGITMTCSGLTGTDTAFRKGMALGGDNIATGTKIAADCTTSCTVTVAQTVPGPGAPAATETIWDGISIENGDPARPVPINDLAITNQSYLVMNGLTFALSSGNATGGYMLTFGGGPTASQFIGVNGMTAIYGPWSQGYVGASAVTCKLTNQVAINRLVTYYSGGLYAATACANESVGNSLARHSGDNHFFIGPENGVYFHDIFAFGTYVMPYSGAHVDNMQFTDNASPKNVRMRRMFYADADDGHGGAIPPINGGSPWSGHGWIDDGASTACGTAPCYDGVAGNVLTLDTIYYQQGNNPCGPATPIEGTGIAAAALEGGTYMVARIGTSTACLQSVSGTNTFTAGQFTVSGSAVAVPPTVIHDYALENADIRGLINVGCGGNYGQSTGINVTETNYTFLEANTGGLDTAHCNAAGVTFNITTNANLFGTSNIFNGSNYLNNAYFAANNGAGCTPHPAGGGYFDFTNSVFRGGGCTGSSGIQATDFANGAANSPAQPKINLEAETWTGSNTSVVTQIVAEAKPQVGGALDLGGGAYVGALTTTGLWADGSGIDPLAMLATIAP